MSLHQKIRDIILSSLAGVLSGVAAAIFLWLLQEATRLREANLQIIWFLPLAGFVLGMVYHYGGASMARGTDLILDEIHQPQNRVRWIMAPLVLVATVVTHLFGGSAGREGTVVQMGAALSNQLGRWFDLSIEKRRALLMAGAGAGFGAALGAPWAGAVFGMEFTRRSGLDAKPWLECGVASLMGYFTIKFFSVEHVVYPQLLTIHYDFKTVKAVFILGLLSGLAAFLFCILVRLIKKAFSLLSYPPARPACAGLLLALLFFYEGSYLYDGLGLNVVEASFFQTSSFEMPLYKMIFTALTVGGGFYGGEFVPLVFIGSTMGSALSSLLNVDMQMMASLGFVAVFAGASHTPLACAILALELFGYRVGLYALIVCWMSHQFSGPHGIYHAQQGSKKFFLSFFSLKK